MQLNDILEENSMKAMSQKTKISEENLENLLNQNFDKIKKVKTFGFLSILEREYKADLDVLREAAHEYYSDISEDQSITLGLPVIEERKGKSKFLIFIILGLLGYATWYFLTQFDKKHLSELIPFIDENTIENFMKKTPKVSQKVENLSIAKVNLTPTKSEIPTQAVVPKVAVDTENNASANATSQENTDGTVTMTQTVEDISPPPVALNKSISIVPVKRLWFGMVDIQTKKRENFSISEPYALDVSEKTWLVATSSAPFSLKEVDGTQEFNDAKEHYFKIDKNGIDVLTKNEYVALGGWPQW